MPIIHVMNNFNTSQLLLLGFLLALSITPLSFSAEATKADLAGAWRGKIDPEGAAIELVFHIEANQDGGWSGTVDTPAQNSYGLPLSGISVDGDGSVTIAVAATGGQYRANLQDSGQELEGTWKQGGAELKLECKREAALTPMPTELSDALVGIWEGPLSVGAIELRIVLNLQTQDGGKLGGYMVSPDQSPAEMAVTRVDHLEGRRSRICVGIAFLAMEMDLSDDGQELSGSFHQGRGKFDIALTRKEQISSVRRPQEPKPPFPYKAEEVSYENKAAGVTFAGTLTLPEGTGPFPAVLLISGSGAQDRDESIFQHRPFLVIADHLTRQGIAVLRVDDRGVGGTSAGNDPENATTEDFVGDAICGVDFLRQRKEIAKGQIGLIGHSEGGVIAPMASVRDERIAYIILLAGTGVRGDQLLMRQNELISRASDTDEEEIQTGLALNRKLFDVILRDDLDSAGQAAEIKKILETTEDMDQDQADQIKAQLGNRWIQWFIRHDPVPTLEKVQIPVLALNGTLDLQVPCQENLDAIKTALQRGGNRDHETIAYPSLNHLFQHCETGAITEYATIEETFSTEVLDKMTSWIQRQINHDQKQ
ncbi:MAG: alpha/beta fold hydrolase [Planctomycetota bacterium]|nr:alpha/beta fold hydrolase [Planctomycetota bacterium]